MLRVGEPATLIRVLHPIKKSKFINPFGGIWWKWVSSKYSNYLSTFVYVQSYPSSSYYGLAPKIFFSTAICSFTALLLVPPVASLSSTARS